LLIADFGLRRHRFLNPKSKIQNPKSDIVMDDRVYRFRLGVVVAAAAGILVLLIMLMGDLPRPLTSRYEIFVNFANAPGVSVGTPVRKSGITIGRVKDVQFLENGEGVQLTLQIDGNRRIYEDEKCRISSASLLGDAVVEFYRPADAQQSHPPLQGDTVTGGNGANGLHLVSQVRPGVPPLERRPVPAGETLKGEVASTPADVLVNLEDDVRRALLSIEAAGGKIQVLADNFNLVVGENQDAIPRILQKTEQSLDQFDRTMLSMQDVFGDQELRQRLKASMQDMPVAIADARQTMAQMRESFQNFERVTERADRNLANLEKFTAPLGERGPAIAANLDSSIAKIDALLEQLVEFSENLNNREGTFGRLMNDTELYDRLGRTIANAEDLTKRMRPVVDNLNVFSDKIARDPRQLGVRGALDKRPAGQGTKGLFMNHEIPAVEYEIYPEH
jgi:phospholipid/cholesterol/gamma-HCH transport system substrate-binding protein